MHVVSVPDEHGCNHPTSIWSTPGFWNDGYGNEWPDSKSIDDPEVIAAFKKNHKEYGGESGDKIKRHPAYLSVAVFFNEDPSEAAIGYMIQRAPEFFKNIGHKVNINGYRVVKTKIVEELVRELNA